MYAFENLSPQREKTVTKTTPTSCPRCRGTGDCPDCQGSGHIDCPSCAGRGVNVLHGKEYPCPTCKGQGSLPCPPKCPSCEGAGILNATTKAAAPRIQRRSSRSDYGPAPLTKAFIIICAALYILAPPDLPRLLPQPYPDLIWHYLGPTSHALSGRGCYHLLTAAFLHGNMFHLACNMYCLWYLGLPAESILGWKRYLGLFLCGAVGGSLLSALLNPCPGVGASTAIFAIGTALVYMSQRWSEVPRSAGLSLRRALITIIVLGFFLNMIGIVGISIDNWGHIGGGLAGLAYMHCLKRRRG